MMFRRTLGLKIGLCFLVIALLPIIAISVLLSSQVRENTTVLLKENLSELAGEIGTETERTVFYAYTHIKSLAENPIIQSGGATIEEKLYEMQKISDFYKAFEDITLINLDGVVLASTTYEYRGRWKHKSWFKAAAAGKSVVSPVHAILHPFRLIMITTSPVIGDDGSIKAVLAGRVNMELIWEIVDRVKLGRTGFVFIIDKAGNLLAFPDKDRLLRKLTPDSLREKILETGAGTAEYDTAGGICRFCYYTLLKGYRDYKGQGWVIGISQDIKEAYAVITKMQAQIFLAAGGFVIFVFLLSGLLTRTIVKPIRALVRTTEGISKGDLSQRAEKMTNDEIGELVDSFNDMAEGLSVSIRNEKKLAVAEKKRAVELEGAYKELENTQTMLIQSEKMAVVGQMVTGVEHEVKAPLGIVIQGVNYLERELGPEKGKRREALDIIKKAALRADKIVRDMLGFSRKTPLELKPCDINRVVQSALALLGKELVYRKVKVSNDFTDGLPLALIDSQKIEQVFINVILNAVNAMPEGGRLAIRTCSNSEEKIVVCEFTDTGTGIPKDILKKVFDPFFTASLTGQGTGLGLTITKSIVEMHSGHIDIESIEGKGAKVIIAFPIVEKEDRGG